MPPVNARQLFRGFAPSKVIFQGDNLMHSVGILGATVMPHSLFLGSGLVQPRLREFDLDNGYHKVPEDQDKEEAYYSYKPSINAIKYAMKYSIIELSISLFTFALFVNSAILIVAAASLYGTEAANDADLFTIHKLLSQQVAPIAGTIFMLALLFSGASAGVVCTIAGQIVSEGHLKWNIKPWKRRIITRLISVIPCLIVSLCIGRSGISQALNISQVILSVLLPFLTAPLIYFTSRTKYMKVSKNILNTTQDEDGEEQFIDMSNNWATTIIGFSVWLFISVLNIYMLAKL
jgi:metal iron transporter